MKIGVHSEIGHLQKVIVHTPGREVSLVNPEHKDELLFDDIIFEDDARVEHQNMLKMFRAAMPADGEIIEILDLAIETLETDSARTFLVDRLINDLPQKNLHVVEERLMTMSAEALTKFVVYGAESSTKGFTLHPTPNLLFTRDLAAVIGDHMILSKAAKPARVRESILMDMIATYHPFFEEARTNMIRIAGSQSIEGGDVLVVSDKLVLIGLSERTTFTGMMAVTEHLLNNNVEHVVAVDIPKQRASMHLDTIFTFASKDECIVFPPAIEEERNNVVVLSKPGDKIVTDPVPTLKNALEDLMGHEIHFINCGGDDRTDQFREQWTDGANVFALAPGIIAGYERNTKTFNALIENGYRYMNQFEFIEEFEEKEFVPSEEDKIAVSFQGNELCRGRGGARCMTLPLLRKQL